jgi:hypothetical protein
LKAEFLPPFFSASVAADFMNNTEKNGLFTDQGCSSGKEVAPEDVVNSLEGATTKPML